MESFIESAEWTKLRRLAISYSLNTVAFRQRQSSTLWNSVFQVETCSCGLISKGNDPGDQFERI